MPSLKRDDVCVYMHIHTQWNVSYPNVLAPNPVRNSEYSMGLKLGKAYVCYTIYSRLTLNPAKVLLCMQSLGACECQQVREIDVLSFSCSVSVSIA